MNIYEADLTKPVSETGLASSPKPVSICGKPVSPGLTKPVLVKPVFTQTGFNETGSVAIAVETGSVTDFRFGLRPLWKGNMPSEVGDCMRTKS